MIKDRPGVPVYLFLLVGAGMNKKNSLVLILLLAGVLMFLFIPYKKALVFESQKSEILLAFVPFIHDSTFKIKYTHSIHLSDVVESFRVQNSDKLELYELQYEDFAIGMPANAEVGERFVEKNGKYYIENMQRKFQSIDLRIGQVKANHTIIYHGKSYILAKSIQSRSAVRLKIKKLNQFQLWRGVNILES